MLNFWHRANFSNSLAIPFLNERLPSNTTCSDRTISDGFKVFVNSYVPTRGRKGIVAEDNLDSPFTELGLIRETKGLKESQYEFNLEDKLSISSALIAYCVNDFWSNNYENSNHLSFSEVSFAAGSPGQIFKMPELAVRRHLDQLDSVSNGRISYIESASLQQIVRKNDLTLSMDLLDSIYQD
jgi:hypothetical protein